ncbi:unnamed protein product [Lactuca virosa]|uniref:Uncharacterized protein n=1 Tax=Lactuca virosa TaxID=75947 RepID=A0AAU9LGE1_9ASTR|nr:unnamed protein product [Lactuca virosa]
MNEDQCNGYWMIQLTKGTVGLGTRVFFLMMADRKMKASKNAFDAIIDTDITSFHRVGIYKLKVKLTSHIMFLRILNHRLVCRAFQQKDFRSRRCTSHRCMI